MESAEIRRRWLSFYEERGHTVVPSASLIADDPTLLLVPAGMAQREGELHDALGLKVRDESPALPAGDEAPGLTARNSDVPAPRRGITYNGYDRKDEH